MRPLTSFRFKTSCFIRDQPAFVVRLLILTLVIPVAACVAIARVDDFPKTAESIDFDKLSKQSFKSPESLWSFRSERDYYVEVEKVSPERLLQAIDQAMQSSGYSVSYKSTNGPKGVVIGERGLRNNEWASVTGVYYRINDNNVQIYFKNKITQDITGGLARNLAQQAANSLCTFVLCQRE